MLSTSDVFNSSKEGIDVGSMRFKRLVPVEGSILNDFQFDSSPQYSLSKALGTDPDHFELREIGEERGRISYEVYAASYGAAGDGSRPMVLRGHMTWDSPEARRIQGRAC